MSNLTDLQEFINRTVDEAIAADPRRVAWADVLAETKGHSFTLRDRVNASLMIGQVPAQDTAKNNLLRAFYAAVQDDRVEHARAIWLGIELKFYRYMGERIAEVIA